MTKEDVCCGKFDPALWDERKVTWEDKTFVTKSVPQFLHMPLPGVYGKAITALMTAVDNANARPEIKDFLLLARDPSPWKSNLYISTTKEVPDVENVKLSGTFLAKVFDGPYQNVPKYMAEMENYATSKGERALDYYFYYTYCPKCAEKYGHNYIVVFAKVG